MVIESSFLLRIQNSSSHIIDEGGELGNVVVHPHKSECGDFIYNVNKKYEQHLDHLKVSVAHKSFK